MLRKPFQTGSADPKTSIYQKYQSIRAKAADLHKEKKTPTNRDLNQVHSQVTNDLPKKRPQSTKSPDLPRQTPHNSVE